MFSRRIGWDWKDKKESPDPSSTLLVDYVILGEGQRNSKAAVGGLLSRVSTSNPKPPTIDITMLKLRLFVIALLVAVAQAAAAGPFSSSLSFHDNVD